MGTIGFVIILLIVGALMRGKLQELLHEHMETQITVQMQTMAELFNARMQSELEQLEAVAGYIEQTKDTKHIWKEHQQEENVITGLLTLKGEALWGNFLDVTKYTGIRESFRGNKAVSYQHGGGLLFTVPVFNGNNVKYVLYKLYKGDILAEIFEMSCYDGLGTVMMVDISGQVVIPGVREGAENLLQDRVWEEKAEEFSEKLNIATATTVYSKADGGKFLFVAEVGHTNMRLVGSVPEEVVMEEISYVSFLILWVFGLLLVLFVVGIIYIFGAEEKVKESEELREAKKSAEQANKAKSDFLANMSHEIRTPINAVIGMNEMILRESQDDEIREYALNIQSASQSLLALINDILDFSKIEAGKLEITNAEYELTSLVRDVCTMVFAKKGRKNIEFLIDVDETLPSVLYGDEMRIRQILLNLLNNALKYTTEGNIYFRIKGKEEADKKIVFCFEVEDTGMGIREEDKKKLFKQFQRLDLKKNRNIEGTGLGLAIIYLLLNQMHGKIEVESTYGKGSLFRVYLPQKIVKENCVGKFSLNTMPKKEEVYKESFVAPNAKILVTDDNEMNLFVIKNLLKKTQIQIVTCNDGAECLKRTEHEKFDMIFLDHMMPGLDGVETLKLLRASESNVCKDVPVIILTANALFGSKEMYLQEGFTDYLSKPVDGSLLEKMIFKYLQQQGVPVNITEVKKSEREEKEEISEILSGNLKEETEEKTELLDLEKGMKYCGGMKEMYAEFLQMFCDLSGEKMAELQKSFECQKWEDYIIQIHALKSTSLSIGGVKVSEFAFELEKAGKAGDYIYIIEHHDEVMELYTQTVVAVKSYMNQK